SFKVCIIGELLPLLLIPRSSSFSRLACVRIRALSVEMFPDADKGLRLTGRTGCADKSFAVLLNFRERYLRDPSILRSFLRIGCLEFRVARRTWKGDHVADVLQTGEVHHHALQAEAEA